MADRERFDLLVVGAGPGGYVASVRAAQLGMRVACVEREERLGGVCLRVGCIPSKALLDSSELYHSVRRQAAEHGVQVGEVHLDLAAMLARKDRVVEELTGNVRSLLERNGVEIVRGTARLSGPESLTVSPAGGGDPVELQGRRVLLATGSEPVTLSGIDLDEERIVTSSGALAFPQVPQRLVVVGGGYIGLELGSVWARLGAQVTVLEALPTVAAGLDGQVRRALERILKRQGLELRTHTRVAGAEVHGEEVRVTLADASGKVQEQPLLCDRLLVCVGRRPATDDLGLAEVGVATESHSGRVVVDEMYRTAVPTVFAIGDLIAGPMLAHKASAEGVAAVEQMAGIAAEVNYDAVPAVIYTWPEVASVGKTEEQLKEAGVAYCVGTYPFAGTGRARCMGETDGFVKVLAQQRSDRILGVHIIGPRASDMIAEGVLAMEMGASSEDLARTVHGHPTFAEALMEAAASIRQCSIYGR